MIQQPQGPDQGPFFHGTKAALQLGDLLTPQHESNFQSKKSNHIYFTATLNAAKWGAELATADGAEHIYIVEPLGPFEHDPNLTDQKFPGNPTRSYRSKTPLRIVAELSSWERHSDAEIAQMHTVLEALRAENIAKIDD